MNNIVHGSCLCGQVQYQVTGPFEQFHICHCSQCRRSTGSAHASNIFTSKDKIKWISGEDLLKRFDPDQPNTISTCFCSHCGSLVPYVSSKGGRLIIPAGGLSEDPHIRPQDNIFWKDRAPWYDTVAPATHFDAFPKKNH